MKVRHSSFPHALLITLLCLLIAGSGLYSDETDKTTVTYLGQTPPGMTPEKFAPGLVSTDGQEFGISFSPDGKEIYFTRNQVVQFHTIMTSFIKDGLWTDPVPLEATKDLDAFEPCVTYDGERIYFVSPGTSTGGGMPEMDLFYIERTEQGWSDTINLGPPFNPGEVMFVSTTCDGTLYTTKSAGGPLQSDIVRTHPVDGQYGEFEKLGPEINSDGMDAYPYISPDERYLIFGSILPDGKRGLFVSFRNSEDKWSPRYPINLGSLEAGLPWVSPDGRYLFFSALGDIYWVDIRVVPGLTPPRS